jgi:hypothetical protein
MTSRCCGWPAVIIVLGAACQREIPTAVPEPRADTRAEGVLPTDERPHPVASSSDLVPSAPDTPKSGCGTQGESWVWPANVVGDGTKGPRAGRPRRVEVSAIVPWPVQVGQAVSAIAEPWNLPTQDVIVTEVRVQPARDGRAASWILTADAATTPYASLEPPQSGDIWSKPAVLACPTTRFVVIPREEVGTDLPDEVGASLRTLSVALDTRGEGRPDFEMFDFWCERPDTPISEPSKDPTALWCRTVYRRSGRKYWKRILESRDD